MNRKMPSVMLLALCATAILASVLPSVSVAAIAQETSVLYFDSHDNIIGQRVTYCNNQSFHAGSTDSQNQYQIEFKAQCDDTTGNCYIGDTNCGSLDLGDTQLQVTYFHSATGKSISYYCNTQHAPGTPFYGAPDCKMVPPQRDWNLSPWLSGL